MNTQLITIYFDGGCKPTNPGNKYGSWAVEHGERVIAKHSREQYGFGTSSESEFNALMSAVKWVLKDLNAGGLNPKFYRLLLFTDSLNVQRRVSRRNFRGKDEPARRMAALAKRSVLLLDLFASWRITWERRNANVARFGH